MKARKVMALFLAAAMTFSLVGCGSDDATTSSDSVETPEKVTEEPETTAEPEDTANAALEVGEVSIDFEDGVFGFAGVDKSVNSAGDDSALSVGDFEGSKALKVETKGKASYVAIQADALLGDNASSLKTVELTIGIENPDGTFGACSGSIYAFVGEDNAKDSVTWSVYMENGNPKRFTYEVPDGQSFGEGNYIVVSLEEDAQKGKGATPASFYIDDIAFKDASGNVLTVDTSAEFVAADTGADPNLLSITDAVELDGFAVSGGAWSQAGIELTEEQKALFVPGSVIEITYSSAAPVWLVAICAEDNPNPMGGWLRGVNQETFLVDGYVASTNNVVQYTYEQLVPYFGDDYGQFLDTLQCESSEDWEVYGVKVGTKSDFVTLANATELEGFAVSAGGWSQAGIELTEEQKALFVPGSIIEITYSCETPVWLVAICAEDNPNPMGGWLRGVDQDTFIPDGAVNSKGDAIQFTYEQLVPYFGDDYGQFLDTLQCEGQTDWEVYSVKVGTAAISPRTNVTELEGFAVSAGGWSQAGIELSEEQKALFVPGTAINITYSCDMPVWLVAICAEDNPNPMGGWLRGVDQDTFIPDGAVNAAGNLIQYTYEQLVPYFGDDYGQFLDTLQCEGQLDWEVYSVSIGTVPEE